MRNEEPSSSSSGALLADVEAGKINGFASIITLAEILVGAHKGGSAANKTIRMALSKLESEGFKFVPVDKAVADKGAEIRASYGLYLPDALIAATGVLSYANSLVTRDKKMYAKVRGLKVSTPEDIGYK